MTNKLRSVIEEKKKEMFYVSDAAALLWIWCVENGDITLPNRDT